MALPQGCSEEPAGRLALTVLIPTHNRPVLLLRAVSSALADLPPRAEVLVVDDASDVAAAQTLLFHVSDSCSIGSQAAVYGMTHPSIPKKGSHHQTVGSNRLARRRMCPEKGQD